MRQLGNFAPELAHGRIVLAHLGGGSSLCAVRNGGCVNTTMGMTPLGGIAMSTRPGSLDPGVILHLQRHLGIPPAELDRLLWRESGLKGLSGESGDMRVLLASPSKSSMRAIDVYVAGVVHGIAAMAASIGGIDALTFSGGIGMHAAPVRARIVDALGWLGVQTEDHLNRQGTVEISRPGAPVRTFVMSVDEEFEMADAVGSLVESG
jgi:acetate kinase